jgi:hypothetical protein
VFNGDEAVGLIDWDGDVARGPRLADLAHAVWCFVDVGEHGGPLEEQRRRVRMMCDAYGGADPAAVIDEIADRLRRARDNHSTEGRHEATAIFERLLGWIERHRPALKSASLARAAQGGDPP